MSPKIHEVLERNVPRGPGRQHTPVFPTLGSDLVHGLVILHLLRQCPPETETDTRVPVRPVARGPWPVASAGPGPFPLAPGGDRASFRAPQAPRLHGKD